MARSLNDDEWLAIWALTPGSQKVDINRSMLIVQFGLFLLRPPSRRLARQEREFLVWKSLTAVEPFFRMGRSTEGGAE